jgi:hypothetical protein
MCWMCSRLHSASQTADVNWVPQWEVMTAGTPKRLTQPATKASAIVAASMFLTGIASTHLVDRSAVNDGEEVLEPVRRSGKRPHQIHMEVREPPLWYRDALCRRRRLPRHLSPLAGLAITAPSGHV